MSQDPRIHRRLRRFLQMALALLTVAAPVALAQATWTDPSTGLMWTKESNNADINWNEASAYCANLGLLNYSDWRLPTIDEIREMRRSAVPVLMQGSSSCLVNREINLHGSCLLWTGSAGKAPGQALYYNLDVAEETSVRLDGTFYPIRVLCVHRSWTPQSELVKPTPHPAPQPIQQSQQQTPQLAAPARHDSPQPLTVSAEVKADTLHRLEVARAWIIPNDSNCAKRTDKCTHGLKSILKEERRICNFGPKDSDYRTQADACWSFLNQGGYDDLKSASLDELMPVFKECALGTKGTNGCNWTVMILAATGHSEYALAVAEYAPKCTEFGMDRAIYNRKADPRSRSNIIDFNQEGFPQVAWQDTMRILERGCQEGGDQRYCEVYQQIGGSYDEASRRYAAAKRNAEDVRAEAAKQEQMDTSHQHAADVQQRWSNVAAAVNAGLQPNMIDDALANQKAQLYGMSCMEKGAACSPSTSSTNSGSSSSSGSGYTSKSSQTASPSYSSGSYSQTTHSTSTAASNSNSGSGSSSNSYSNTGSDSGSNSGGSYNPYSYTGASSVSQTGQYGTIQNACVREFYDPDSYNWLSYENTCDHGIYVVWVGYRPGLNGSADIAPGKKANTGWSASEIQAKGGINAYPCLSHYVPVDANGKFITQPVSGFRCKYNGN